VLGNTYVILVRKPEWRRPFGRRILDGRTVLKCVRRIGYLGVDWVYLAQGKALMVAVCMKSIIMQDYYMSLLHSIVSDVNCII
jgi:hypothetical protein